ncbi:MAG: sigma-70 family RNA polymerase sigma factor [Isosphaeraceae bacterium]
MVRADESSEVLLQRARDGDLSARGHLLETYRGYLAVIARALMNPGLRSRVEPSDLVQETLLEAHRDFAQFTDAGTTGLAAWLRKILVRNVIDRDDFHRAERRDVRRERSIDAASGSSGHALIDVLAAPISSPSAQAMRRQEDDALAEALHRLPADYRQVFVLRSLQGVPVEEIAVQMGRSANAVRLLWGRALLKLTVILGRPP